MSATLGRCGKKWLQRLRPPPGQGKGMVYKDLLWLAEARK